MERSTIGGSEWDLRRGDGDGKEDEPLTAVVVEGISASTPESQAE